MRPRGNIVPRRIGHTPAAVAAPSFICSTCRFAAAAAATVARPRRAHPFSSTSPARSHPLPPPPPPSGLVALSSRRLISVSGPDSPKFLQGVITQNILPPSAGNGNISSSAPSGAGSYAAFLNATGRVLHDVFVYPDARGGSPGESFLIEVDAAEAPRLERHIKRYKLRANFAVRLLDPGEVTVWHGWDDSGSNSTGLEKAPHHLVHLKDPRAPGLGYRMVTEGGREPAVGLEGATVDEDVYRVRRYLMGVPEGQSELLREGALPLEGNLDVMGGIDFRKGCYVGQELTIRTKHRGVVRKRVLPAMIYGADSVEQPQQLEYLPPGAVQSAASIPADTSIGRFEKRGRSAGKWLRGVGNVGLALCRLEIMTDVVLPGETAASSYTPADEFIMEREAGENGEEPFKVKIKAFVPDWLRQGLGELQKH